MPTRYLKAEICDSETLDRLTPLAEVLFYRLLVTVDDYGRMDARPSLIKSKCFPVRDSVSTKDVDKLLHELHEKQVIQLYEVEGRTYIQMSKWTNKPRADASKFPAMENGCIQVYANEKQCKANPPVTVTETVTVTGSQANSSVLFPEVENRQLVSDWLKVRKAKKLAITETAIKGFMREVEKSGWTVEQVMTKCCEKGWGGFEAKWIANEQKPQADGAFNLEAWMREKSLGTS